MIVDEDKKSGKQQRRYLVYDMIMLEGEVLIRRPFKVTQLAEQASAPLWWLSAAAGHSLPVQGELGALLHRFCLDGASGTAGVMHGEAIFVRPACLCHLLRASTSQPPLMKPYTW